MKKNTQVTDFMDEKTLNLGLQDLPLSTRCVLIDNLPSTNTWLAQQNDTNTELTVCVCEQQTQGKGRSGKTWHSRTAQDITVSFRWSCPAERKLEISSLSLVTALTLARFCQDQAPSDTFLIKWPNDVMCQDKKIAGILLEQCAPCDVIIGIGLNLAPISPKEIDHIEQAAIGLQELNPELPNRSTLLSRLIADMNHALHRFSQEGFSGFHAEWADFDYLAHTRITHYLGDTKQEGIARGITTNGELILEDSNEKQTLIRSGSVRKR